MKRSSAPAITKSCDFMISSISS
ncbi:hypothetical protein R2601_04188 [Salipiger bermudensis HTCC2601]|uniref:Uncharacterized protein n=1 Tax=Salipiger bermudensis (strain DSM 26914 / JCM 13377 / KCTC 12554 / HTCC2601) TaxID=314265 RepID=Q0FW08_SALBH|nr:hypothetical protein R2601_04188 [Salipiger bermudensis HTCC2601]